MLATFRKSGSPIARHLRDSAYYGYAIAQLEITSPHETNIHGAVMHRRELFPCCHFFSAYLAIACDARTFTLSRTSVTALSITLIGLSPTSQHRHQEALKYHAPASRVEISPSTKMQFIAKASSSPDLIHYGHRQLDRHTDLRPSSSASL